MPALLLSLLIAAATPTPDVEQIIAATVAAAERAHAAKEAERDPTEMGKWILMSAIGALATVAWYLARHELRRLVGGQGQLQLHVKTELDAVREDVKGVARDVATQGRRLDAVEITTRSLEEDRRERDARHRKAQDEQIERLRNQLEAQAKAG